MPTGLLWDAVEADWTEGYDYIPVIKGRKILLVPKVFVKYAKDFTGLGRKYYDGFVASFIRQREMASMGRLVRFKESKRGIKTPYVYKEDIERDTPRNKDSVAEFSLKHPEVYKKFRGSVL